MSLNPDVDPDIPALIGASAALAISGMPFAGPIGAAKVGYKDGEYVLNPGRAACAEGDLELVVAGTKDAVLMVESEASGLSEEVMLGASSCSVTNRCRSQSTPSMSWRAEVGKPAWDWAAAEADEDSDSSRIRGRNWRTFRRLPDYRQSRIDRQPLAYDQVSCR